MGKHYVPKQHLRRFEIPENPGFVWMYDKKTGCFTEATIQKVAQQANYYDPDVEQELADLVEKPGNIAIDKLRRFEECSDEERSQLALYMLIMATRGPRQRKRCLEEAPHILDKVVSDVRQQIEAWRFEEQIDIEAEALLQSRLEEAAAQFQQQLPPDTLRLIRTPFWNERVVECVYEMCWHILPAPSNQFFITSDTPAHIFDCWGVGRPESEFTFPLSAEFALIGEFGRRRSVCYERAQSRLLREVNRRILSHTERFVFTPRKADWIHEIAAKPEPQVNRVRWR